MKCMCLFNAYRKAELFCLYFVAHSFSWADKSFCTSFWGGMLCHYGPVAAIASTDAASLLSNEGHNAAMFCLWPQNKAPLHPSESNFWPIYSHSGSESLGVWILWQVSIQGQKGARKWPQPARTPAVPGWVDAVHCQGPFEGTLRESGTESKEVLWGELAQYQDKSTKSRQVTIVRRIGAIFRLVVVDGHLRSASYE